MTGKEKPGRGSWLPGAKFRQEKLSQSEDNMLKVGVRAHHHHVLNTWKCPPKISLLDEWRVVAGEESVELEVQKQREKTLSEQFYFSHDSIPPNPSVYLDLDNQYQNDSSILHVPLIPIEEVEEVTKAEPTIEMVPHNSSLPQSRIHENVSTAQCCTCVCSRLVVKDGSSRHVIPDMPDQIVSQEPPTNSASASGVDPIVAADVVLAALGQRDLIDMDMLTQLLSNPEMIDELMKKHGLAPSPKAETSQKSDSIISASPPSSMPNLLSEKRVIPGNTERPEAESSQSTVLSGAVEANVWHTHAGFDQVFGLNPMAAPAPLARTSSCRDECRERPQAGTSSMAGIYPSTPLTPKLSLGQAKKLISEYGAPETVGHKPLTRAEHSVSRERVKKLINEYGAPESAVGHNPSPKTTHPFNLPISPNIAYAPSFSPKMNPASRKDLGYDSPISQQKERKEEIDALLLKYLRPESPDLHLREPVSLHKSKPGEPSTSKYRKPCKYFNTSRGCRRGSKCRFKHDAVEDPHAKRIKLPMGIVQGRRVTEGITG